MYENSDSWSPHNIERAQNVTGWFSIKPVDCVSFGDDYECLEVERDGKYYHILFYCIKAISGKAQPETARKEQVVKL